MFQESLHVAVMICGYRYWMLGNPLEYLIMHGCQEPGFCTTLTLANCQTIFKTQHQLETNCPFIPPLGTCTVC